MWLRMLLMLVSVSVLFGSVFGFIHWKNGMISQTIASYTPPPITIAATEAKAEKWETYLYGVGTLKAYNGVDVSAEVDGRVTAVHIESGQTAQAGDLLVQLDDAIERANLKNYQAQLELAQINYDRDLRLYKTRAISQTDMDEVQAQLRSAKALVERTKALIAQKSIRSPFTGRLGIREVDLGQYLTKGRAVVTLQALDKLQVDFFVPEQNLPQLFKGQKIRFQVDAYHDRDFEGAISAINARVDVNTRNLRVRAEIKNPEGNLLPGMFANLKVVLEDDKPVIVVPQTAVSYSLHGNAIYIVKPVKDDPEQLQVERRYITVGARKGKYVEISEGVDVGDTVVTVGQIKLHQGAKVVIDNSVSLY